MSAQRHSIRIGGVLVVATALFGVLRMEAGAASPPTTFDAVASAYGFDAILTNASIPAGISPEGAGPTAQSELTSLPQGTSFASFPYPGDVVAGVPGLLSAIVQNIPQTPAYPFIVSSGLSQGRQTADLPGIGLSADTEASQAQAHAVLGSDGMGGIADTNIAVQRDGGVVATATARMNAINLGALGTIGSVVTTATAAQAANGTVTKSSHLAVTLVDIPGLRVTIPKATPTLAPIPNLPIPTVPLPLAGVTITAPSIGFVDGQFTVALPLLGSHQFAIPASAALSALKAVGIDATYEAAQTTRTSIVGAALTLHYVLPAPPRNSVYNGTTDVSLALGRASASVEGSAGAIGSVPVTGGGSSAPTSGDVGSTAFNGAATPSGGAAVVSAPTPVAGGSPVAGSRASTGSTAPQIALGAVRPGRRLAPVSWGIYLALVAVGLIGTYSTQTLRLLGVRHL